jgi:hypothetical protein
VKSFSIYPSETERLADKIIQESVLISEHGLSSHTYQGFVKPRAIPITISGNIHSACESPDQYGPLGLQHLNFSIAS